MTNGDGGEMRRLLERILDYELKAAEMYDGILEKLGEGRLRRKIEGIRDSELRHAEMARRELRRFQEER
jgi:rubrerythrin